MATISTLVLDAGPIIGNTTLPKAGLYYSTPSVLAELKDETTRSRLQTYYALKTRTPSRQSLEFVRSFAKQTGDAEVLSATDLGIIALTYELECELNGGDWRLRNAPNQARINGKPPQASGPSETESGSAQIKTDLSTSSIDPSTAVDDMQSLNISRATAPVQDRNVIPECSSQIETESSEVSAVTKTEPLEESPELSNGEIVEGEAQESSSDENDSDDGWVTPANIKKHQEKDANIDAAVNESKLMKVACASHDFAMQNVLLQIGLNLVSGDGRRISSVKTWVMRCHACFKITRKMNLLFCPSCGGSTLMRTSVSTDSKGAMKVHLKRNMQWNNRGTIYSIPKQQHGTANMKGRENLILRADQREVEKLQKRDKYKKEVDLLDPDTIPSILSGRRDNSTGFVKVGHGKRNPNSNRKR